MRPERWQGKRALLTGHTGFKGSWLCKWLDMLGAEVLGIALEPDGFSPFHKLRFSPRFREMRIDLAQDDGRLAEAVREFQPEIVFHLAAQASVGRAFEQPLETFQSNVMGTVRLLDALRGAESLGAVVVVTSDKVYENQELGIPFAEGDVLGGDEPYSASKVCQEMVSRAYAQAYLIEQGVGIATARGSNVFGGGDYHYDRLIPGLIDSLLKGEPIALRNPGAVRPWQYVLCLLEGYLRLAEELLDCPKPRLEGWNFGPPIEACVPVGQVAEHLLGKENSKAEKSVFREAGLLSLNAQKSEKALNWQVRLPLEEGLARTLAFYRRERAGEATDDLMREELEQYGRACAGEL